MDEAMDILNMLGNYVAKKYFRKNFWDSETYFFQVEKVVECLEELYSALHTSNRSEA